MDPLSREARTLIDRARAAEDPSVAQRAQLRARVLSGVAAAGVTAASATAGAAAASTKSSLVSSLAGKTFIWLLAGGVTGVVVTAAVSPGSEPAPVARTAPAVIETHASSRAVPPAPRKPVGASASAAPALAAPAAVTASARVAPSTGAAKDPLLEEMHLLEQAQVALREGRPADALAHLQRHSNRYGQGDLEEERAAAEVFALCRLGRQHEGAQRARRFLARFGNSPLAPRVRAACPVSEPPASP